MGKNLYDILGVSVDADEATIKKAYRKKAQTVHPDKETGDTEAFKELVAAYEVLMDAERRKFYDDTGQVKNQSNEQRNKLLQDMIALIFRMIDTYDIQYSNILDAARDVIAEGERKQKTEIERVAESIVEREDVMARLTCKGGEDFLSQAIASDIAARRKGIESMKQHMETAKGLRDMLDQYEYRTDEAPPPPVNFFRMSGSTSTRSF